MNETRKELSSNQGETFKSTNNDKFFNTPTRSRNFFSKGGYAQIRWQGSSNMDKSNGDFF